MKNKGVQQTQLNVSIGTENPSMVSNQSSRQLKQTYTEYISRFGLDIDYSTSSGNDIENSLTEMRIVLKQLNLILNKMMDKNYEYLAQRQHPVNSADKEVEILKAQVQNVKKLAANQDSEITNLNNTLYEMEGKQSYQQELLDQIYEVKKKMPHVELESKHKIGNINKNGYVLLNQEQDTSLYFRVNLLRNDLDRAYERLKKFQEKYNTIVEKERQLQEKTYEITEKFDKSIELARQHSMDVTTNGSIISFKDRYDALLKKKQQQMKKNALQQHVGKNNEVVVQKKISDMKRLLNQYNNKQQQFAKRISQIQRESANLLQKSNVLNKMAQKSFSFRYAEVLLKGEKVEKQKQKVKGKDKSRQYDDYEDDFEELQEHKNTSRIVSKSNNMKQKQQSNYLYKPSLNSVRRKNELGQNVYEKSMSLVQIPSKNKQKNSNFSFEDDIKEQQIKNKNPKFHIRRSSANQIKKNDQREPKLIPDKGPESPVVKHWKDDRNQNGKNSLEGQYKISKPLLNVKRKVNNTSAIQSYEKEQKSKKSIKQDPQQFEIQPKFSRLTQKKTGNKMTDEYMTYLEDKGRKILGLS